ncbi:MAG: protein kinase [Armatimonadetes bacterium]|nr:protein kinase [Armatimonadota bacterium]
MSASSTNTIGKYQIVREIARSNDIVYEAVDPSINRRVALKELSIPPNMTGAQRRERIERFLREGRAAGKLAHPGIVTIYEVGKDGDRYFIAMEFLEGQTLRDRIMAGGPLSIRDAIEITLQLCSALAYAHENGVIHRDIKPDNVQILPGGHVKLTDFGIARLTGESSITQDGQVFGTPSYMSPEQVAGKKLDTRSDIFSLGVMLYEMIAGKKPFAGDSVVTITYNIVHMEAPPPPGAPPWLVGIIRKAMAKEPDARYSKVEDMAQDLRDERASGVCLPDLSAPGAWPQPGGGATQDPFGQAGGTQPQMTPYGTPMPSPQAGSAPDPFAQPPPAPVTPPLPPQPIMSAETRNFVGIFLLVVALTGMLAFAIWAVNLAFTSYKIAVTSGAAAEYYERGEKLYRSGDLKGAVEQWGRAVQASPDSAVAANARKRLFEISVGLARQDYDAGNFAGVEIQAKTLIEAAADRPEGHFYMAVVHESKNEVDRAKEEYAQAIDLGGADAYAQAARQRLGRMYLNEGDRLAASRQVEQAVGAYQNAKRYGDAEIMQIAEQKIAGLNYR